MLSSGSSSIYLPLLPSIFTKVNQKNKEEGRSGTTGTGVSQKDLQRGAETNKQRNVIGKEGICQPKRTPNAGTRGFLGSKL